MTVEACISVFLAVGCLAAVVGVRRGNKTAYALLASAIFSTVLCEAGVPFHPSLWLAIDMAVIMWILVGWADNVMHGNYGRRRDVAILAIFALIWPLYFMPWLTWRADAIDVLVALQLVLTFPFIQARGKVRERLNRRDDDPGPMRFALA